MILIDLLIFFCTVLFSMILCWILLKTVPCLIAQKDCIYIGDVKKFSNYSAALTSKPINA